MLLVLSVVAGVTLTILSVVLGTLFLPSQGRDKMLSALVLAAVVS